MNVLRSWIRAPYLAAYLAFVALAFEWLPPLSGGRAAGGLLFGHLPDPALAARYAGVGGLFMAMALGLAGPTSAKARLGLLAMVIAALIGLAPMVSAIGGLQLHTAALLAGGLILPLALVRDAQPKPEPESRGSQVGIALGGAALTVGLIALESRLALFGHGQTAERHVDALVLLCLALLGGLAFGLPMVLKKEVPAKLPTLAAATATVGALVGLVLLAPLSSNRGLDAFMRHFGLGLGDIGHLEGILLLAARSTLLSGFALGVLWVSLTTRRRQSALFLGIAAGHMAWPHALQLSPDLPTALMAACGLAVASSLPFAIPRRMSEAPATLILIVLGAAPLLLPRSDALPLQPWLRFEAEALFQADSPLGLIAVESTVDGQPVLSINRIKLTPPASEVEADTKRFVSSLNLLASTWQADDPDPAVLLAGQLTLERMLAFGDWNEATGLNASLAWTTPWNAAQGVIRPHLEITWNLPEPLSFAEAQSKIGSGQIDLVIIPMAFGPQVSSLTAAAPPRARAPMASVLMARKGSAASQASVTWIPADGADVVADWGPTILIEGSDLDHLGLGVPHQLETSDEIQMDQAGTARAPDSAIARIALRPENRSRIDRAQLFRRLAHANEDFLPMANLMATQVRSSPWSEPDERFEIDGQALAAMAAQITAQPTALQKLTWNHLARILVAKRLPSDISQLFPSILESTGRWPELEYALGRAYLEFLMDEQAAALLSPLYEEGLLTTLPLVQYADSCARLGQWSRAVEVLQSASDISPPGHALQRKTAIASAQAGLPEAAGLIQALLEADPDDTELSIYLAPGPFPAAPAGFDPTPLAESEHEQH